MSRRATGEVRLAIHRQAGLVTITRGGRVVTLALPEAVALARELLAQLAPRSGGIS